MANKTKLSTLIPVLVAFFVMSYCDIIGISSNYAKADFALSNTVASFFSTLLFIWFLVLSIPAGMIMNKIGRKNTVLIGLVTTLVALVCPFAVYTKASMFVAFSLLGIGNTFIQVSLNPLMASLVDSQKASSMLTLGQLIKAVGSFLAPIVATQAALVFGDWKYLFIVYGVIALVSIIYLFLTPMKESDGQQQKKQTSFLSCIKLLGNGAILLCFVGIVMHVGVDVGMNVTAPQIMMERCGMDLAAAGYVTSIYFLFRTAGCFAGTVIMAKWSPAKFFAVSIAFIALGLVGLFFFESQILLYACVALVGIGNSNVFSVIFASALQVLPAKANETSSLMVMGISGGAVVPVIMGAASDAVNAQNGAVVVLAICTAYLAFLAVKFNKQNA